MSEHVAVLGAGPMGLACAYRLLKLGRQVTIYEADSRIGGMSASFDFDGLTIERYYHFICAPDTSLFAMLRELGLEDRLRWVSTRMGFYYNGVLYEWGRPDRLLAFPHLDLVSKVRYALNVLYSKSVKDWSRLDRLEARSWLKRWLGERAYDVLWKSLFDYKFYEHAGSLSAAWIAARVQRVAKSRKSAFEESLGYLEGGSETLLAALDREIRAAGGRIALGSRVLEVVASEGRVRGVRTPQGTTAHDAVIATIPIQYLPRMVPALGAAERAKIEAIDNIAVACVILKLTDSVTPYFWTNVNDPGMEIPGVIEYSNLQSYGAHIVYVPYYMPKTHPKYRRPDAEYFAEVYSYLARINPRFDRSWVLASRVSRYELAQPVCTPGFFAKLPPMKTSLGGFFMADTSYYYPEDRCISESIRIGEMLARLAAE